MAAPVQVRLHRSPPSQQSDIPQPTDVAVLSQHTLGCTLCSTQSFRFSTSTTGCCCYLPFQLVWFFIFQLVGAAAAVTVPLPHYTLSAFYHPPLFPSSDSRFPAKICKLALFFFFCLSKAMFELGAAGVLITFAFHFVAGY